MTPYAGSPCTASNNPTEATISELYVDPSTLNGAGAMEQRRAGGAAHAVGSVVTTVPSALAVGGTYLIFSEISYLLHRPQCGYDGESTAST